MRKDLTDFGFYNPLLKGEQIRRYNEVKNMSEKKNQTGNKPDFRVVVPIELKNGETLFHQIGSGWQKEKGISVALNSVPMQTNIFIFKNEDKPEDK